LAVPRDLREESSASLPVQSGEADADAETLCQNSDVAIFVPQTSYVLYAREKVGIASHERIRKRSEKSDTVCRALC
jgi:hypothetical protein